MSYWNNQLRDRINKLLSREYSVEEFREAYYMFFIDEVPEDALLEDTYDYFSDIQQKLDWVTEKPDEDERKYGWIDNEEFVKWVENIIKDK